MRRRFFATINHPPPTPPSEPFTYFSENGNGHARVSTRQTTLEPATGGADRAMSWTGWFISHNVGNQIQRLFTVGGTADSSQQYSLNIMESDNQSGLAHLFRFVLFNTGQTAYIGFNSTGKILRSRLYHYAVTYSGSATTGGFKLYLNGVEDTTKAAVSGGTYTTAGQSADWRFQMGSVVGAASAQNFRGRQKNQTVWNRVLTQAEVTELVNLGAGDVTSLAWYAAAVVAHWPFASDMNCANSATFNFGTINNISFNSYPFGFNYKFVSVFNGVIPNARYVAFGTMFKKANGKFAVKIRSGTDHVTAGKIIDLEFDTNGNYSVSSPTDILTDTDDLRQAQAGITDGTDITFFSGTYSGGVVQDVFWVKSTDGLTGLTYGAKNSVASILPGGTAHGLTYGKLVPGYVAGEYVVPWYSGNVGGTYKIGLLKRSALGVWSYVPVYSGATAYVEPAILRAEDNTYVLIMRLLGGNELHMTYSTDGDATWSAPANTTIGTGECIADICMMPNTRNIVLCYVDRGTGRGSISYGNRLADILADPTDWTAPQDIFQRNTAFIGGINAILGYFSIVPDGYNIAGMVSAERTANAADLYSFYGQVDFV